MSDLFFNVFEITVYVGITVVSILLVSYSIFKFVNKKIEKGKKEAEKEAEIEKSIRRVASWISVVAENEKIQLEIRKTISGEGIIISSEVKKILGQSLQNKEIFKSMKKIIFMCLGIYINKLQKIFSVEENIQKKLKTMKEKNQKLSDSKFFSFLNVVEDKISMREDAEKFVTKSLEKLGFLNTENINEYRNILLLFNPEKDIERKNLNSMGSEDFSD